LLLLCGLRLCVGVGHFFLGPSGAIHHRFYIWYALLAKLLARLLFERAPLSGRDPLCTLCTSSPVSAKRPLTCKAAAASRSSCLRIFDDADPNGAQRRQRDVAARARQVGRSRVSISFSTTAASAAAVSAMAVCFSTVAARLASSAFFRAASSSARCGRLLLQLASGLGPLVLL